MSNTVICKQEIGARSIARTEAANKKASIRTDKRSILRLREKVFVRGPLGANANALKSTSFDKTDPPG